MLATRPRPSNAGLMGRATADLLLAMGYNVSGWSRTPKQLQVRAWWPCACLCPTASRPPCVCCSTPGVSLTASEQPRTVPPHDCAQAARIRRRWCALHVCRAVQGVTCYAGQEQLQVFVAQQDVLVCLLPLTAATEGVHVSS
jgi:hypothetical protein